MKPNPDWQDIEDRVRLGMWYEQENRIHDQGQPLRGLARCKQLFVEEELLCVQLGEFSQLAAALNRILKRRPLIDAFVIYNGPIGGADELSLDEKGDPVVKVSRQVYSGFLFDAKSEVVVTLDDDSREALEVANCNCKLAAKGWFNEDSDFAS